MPLFNEDRTVAVIQNGEIYNFAELREELLVGGHRFTSATDTEVLAHLYEDKNERTFDELDGMYAIAIWDDRRKRLLLARDRFGEKPLYLYQGSSGIAFASELKSLTLCPFFACEMDQGALDQFLTLGYILAPRSPFRGVSKLKPGHFLTFDQATGEINTRCYWRHPSHGAQLDVRREDEYLEEFRCLFSDSVKSRMISDVPVGAFLSGGIDSSLVVAEMLRARTGPLRTYSIGFAASERHDENLVAEKVAHTLGVEHTAIPVELSDLVQVIEEQPVL
jgi:asparagine synthase (glutamine-hydrolysing)